MGQSSKLSIMFLATVGITVVVSFFVRFLPEGISIPLYASVLLSELLLALPIVYDLIQTKTSWKQIVQKRRISLGSVVCLIGLVFVLEPVVAVLNLISSMVFGNAVVSISEELLKLPLALNILFVALLPAYMEEWIFRGFYFGGLRRYGFWKAALLSGLFFGLIHMNWNQFSYGFVVGIVAALVYEATGSIYGPMLLHFGLNFQSVSAIESLKEVSQIDTAAQESMDSLLAQVQAFSSETEALLNIVSVGMLSVMALIGLALVVFLIWLAAKLNDRGDYLHWVLFGGEKRQLKAYHNGSFWTVYVAAALVIPAVLICLVG